MNGDHRRPRGPRSGGPPLAGGPRQSDPNPPLKHEYRLAIQLLSSYWDEHDEDDRHFSMGKVPWGDAVRKVDADAWEEVAFQLCAVIDRIFRALRDMPA